MDAPRKPRRRWFQYSLRSLLVLVMLCAIFFSWLAVSIRQMEREREIAVAVEKLGGRVDWSEPAALSRCASLVGEDFLFRHVESVSLYGCDADPNTALHHLRGLPKLRRLFISANQACDIDVEQARELTQLEWSFIWGWNVTEEKIKKLEQALPDCIIER